MADDIIVVNMSEEMKRDFEIAKEYMQDIASYSPIMFKSPEFREYITPIIEELETEVEESEDVVGELETEVSELKLQLEDYKEKAEKWDAIKIQLDKVKEALDSLELE